MSRKSSTRYWAKSLELWRAEIEWSCGISACFQLSFAKRGLAAILVLELPSRSHRKRCPPSRLQKKFESDLIPKLRKVIEQREGSRNSHKICAGWCALLLAQMNATDQHDRSALWAEAVQMEC